MVARKWSAKSLDANYQHGKFVSNCLLQGQKCDTVKAEAAKEFETEYYAEAPLVSKAGFEEEERERKKKRISLEKCHVETYPTLDLIRCYQVECPKMDTREGAAAAADIKKAERVTMREKDLMVKIEHVEEVECPEMDTRECFSRISYKTRKILTINDHTYYLLLV